jgi:hypothetical protein
VLEGRYDQQNQYDDNQENRQGLVELARHIKANQDQEQQKRPRKEDWGEDVGQWRNVRPKIVTPYRVTGMAAGRLPKFPGEPCEIDGEKDNRQHERPQREPSAWWLHDERDALS